MEYKNEDQLREEAQTRKKICLYILEKKSGNQFLEKEDLERIAPDIFVPRLLSSYGPGPFEYDDMIYEQLQDIMDSFMHRSQYGWSDKIVTSLLTEIGVTQIIKMETDFSRKPTGYYKIKGIFQDKVHFYIYNVVRTE